MAAPQAAPVPRGSPVCTGASQTRRSSQAGRLLGLATSAPLARTAAPPPARPSGAQQGPLRRRKAQNPARPVPRASSAVATPRSRRPALCAISALRERSRRQHARRRRTAPRRCSVPSMSARESGGPKDEPASLSYPPCTPACSSSADPVPLGATASPAPSPASAQRATSASSATATHPRSLPTASCLKSATPARGDTGAGRARALPRRAPTAPLARSCAERARRCAARAQTVTHVCCGAC
jgi:hypothetical protein